MCHFVLVFFSPFSIAITSFGEERANLSAFRATVRFVLVWICQFPLPLGVWEGLQFVIVALPGLPFFCIHAVFFFFFFFFLFFFLDKEGNFCDFLFALLKTSPFLKRGQFYTKSAPKADSLLLDPFSEVVVNQNQRNTFSGKQLSNLIFSCSLFLELTPV